MSTKIEWTDFTWNPVRGCSMAPGSESGGCLNCYAARIATRFSGAHPEPGPVVASWKKQPFHGFARRTANGPRWTGRVELVESKLTEPLHKPSWRGKRGFVNSMSDLFHEALPDEAIDRVFAVMALCPEITFQVVTKRAERMAQWFSRSAFEAVADLAMRYRFTSDFESDYEFDSRDASSELDWPLPNVWLIVSAEDQPTADARIPHLLDTPAAVRGVSYEPALGPVDFAPWIEKLDWIIAGGESGPGARPSHPGWFRSVRDQCAAAGVPLFFKQWGEWAPNCISPNCLDRPKPHREISRPSPGYRGVMFHCGKRNAGRLLDNCEHSEFPR